MARQPQPEQKRAPIQTIRAGNLSVSIWENEGTNGKWYSANAQRSFTQDEGKTWEYSDSFGRDDLPAVSQLLAIAFAWIIRQEAKNAQERRGND